MRLRGKGNWGNGEEGIEILGFLMKERWKGREGLGDGRPC